MSGKKQGVKDFRAHVFEVALKWIIWMIGNCDLKACLLENVKGVLMYLNGEAPYFERVLQMLRAKVPHWGWAVDTLRSADYMLPSQRERVILRGLHKAYSPTGVPPCLPPFGTAHLRDFLCKGLPIVLSSSFTEQMQLNKTWFDAQVAEALRSGEAGPADICVYGLDRQAGLVYRPVWKLNVVPTLTTSNQYLFVCIAGEVGLSDEAKTLHRWLTPGERFGLQGKSPMMAAHIVSKAKCIKGAGNSYPTSIIVAGLGPMLNKISSAGGPLTHI